MSPVKECSYLGKENRLKGCREEYKGPRATLGAQAYCLLNWADIS